MSWPFIWGLLLAVLWAVTPIRHVVESSMALTMLVQLPGLLMAGMLMGGRLSAQGPQKGRLKGWRPFDAYGLASWTLVSAVTAVWMLPIALDLALLHPAWEAAKLISWIAAGAALRLAWPRTPLGLKAFFLGNLAWMTATVGLLYMEAEQRLCVSFLLEDQLWAGRGLLLYAAAMLLLCVLKCRAAA